jgi:hypothetical protein
MAPMRPLVAVRRTVAFDPRFLERDPLFWPLAPGADRLPLRADFPAVAALGRVFEGPAPVRFVPAPPRRRRRAPVDVASLYDARITLEGAVPTRERCWHDLMNALVWGAFPRAKRALHARQHRAISERIAPGSRALPHRSPELDALALLDEGGLVVLAPDPAVLGAALRGAGALQTAIASESAQAVVFGHAIYESLALGVTPAVVAALVLETPGGSRCSFLQRVDAALAQALDDRTGLRSPRELARVDVGEARPRRHLVARQTCAGEGPGEPR